MGVRRIAILGSTGSIGCSTLKVIARHPDRYDVVGLSGHGNLDLLARQCRDTGARYAVISDPARAQELETALAQVGSHAEVLAGADALEDLVAMPEVDMVMAAIVGAAGLKPTLRATLEGKQVLLANKESMVIAGSLFRQATRDSGANIIPVDSEHNALFQALPGEFGKGLSQCGVEKLLLTASGGPFLDRDHASLVAVTPDEACAHPNWDMGRKISVDSATLMNKGLEVIEARWLFNTSPGEIEVVVHPQSIIHSMVAYRDGSVIAQMGNPDMRTPIAHALAWPERIDSGVAPLDLAAIGQLDFQSPDLERFPCLGLAFDALGASTGAPAVLNAANEVAVQAFLEEKIGFMQIPQIIEFTMNAVDAGDIESLEDVLALDQESRVLAASMQEHRKSIHV